MRGSKRAARVAGAGAAHKQVFPVPQKLGVCVLILTVIALLAGRLRAEIALSLVGAVFLVTLGYCFLITLFLGLVNRKKAAAASVRILTRQIRAGEQVEFAFALNAPYESKRFIRLPGILIRYELRVITKDRRRVRHRFDPDFLKNRVNTFPIQERGAYYSNTSDADQLMLFDALGFFQLCLRVPVDTGCRLLAIPKLAEPLPIQTRSGGEEQRNAPRFLRTDNFIDHRPYVPGDDPRRINWKLYGHSGELFIREGEPEPPPHSQLLILVDTQADSACYSEEAARCGVDLLCESALAIVAEYAERGMELSVGYSGGDIAGGNLQELAALLAYPAATGLPAELGLPMPVEERGVLILALPRERIGNSGLDQFLR
ncbi:MAG: DUF58 domain-containing protein, partial [Treponema sp.]|nr:DUF58 domain-containing protein [Treponema sp.]